MNEKLSLYLENNLYLEIIPCVCTILTHLLTGGFRSLMTDMHCFTREVLELLQPTQILLKDASIIKLPEKSSRSHDVSSISSLDKAQKKFKTIPEITVEKPLSSRSQLAWLLSLALIRKGAIY